jgi:4-amino-4-deoxy-L-arabinose transferase-like glycosyltransferase
LRPYVEVGAIVIDTEGSPRHAARAGVIVMLVALGCVVRLILGMRAQLDADEATFGLAALHITQGQFLLMEPNGQYLGALDAYVAAPFIGIFGTELLAVRLPLAMLGGLYVLSMYWLGRTLFKRYDYAVLTALIAAVFPLFTVFWASKLRGGYAELPMFEALTLTLCVKIAWSDGRRLRWWALLGLIIGVALWSDLLFIVVALVVGVVILMRGPSIGWKFARRGAGAASVGGVIGFIPWLTFNLPNNLHSLHAIPKNYVGFRTGVSNLLSEHLPILVGGSSSCSHDVVPPVVSDALLGLLLAMILLLRRRSIANLLRGRFSAIEPIDVVFAVLPVTIVFLVVSRLNFDACEPRYVMPLAVPLVIGVVAALTVRWPWRSISIAIAGGWFIVTAIAASGPLVEMQTTTATGAAIPADLHTALLIINREQPAALWAQYWLSRPLSYYSGDALAIGVYGGYVGFVGRQQRVQTAANPSWVFVSGDSEVLDFERACARQGIKFVRFAGGGLVLYTHLTGTVEPSDVFAGAESKTS